MNVMFIPRQPLNAAIYLLLIGLQVLRVVCLSYLCPKT
jgi:hypothetical protein